MIQLELQPELEAQLAAEAEATGLSVADLVQNIVRKRLLGLVSDITTEEGIRRGLADIAAGRTRPAAEVFDELRERYRIPR